MQVSVKPAFVSRRGAVASEHPFPSLIGLSVLERGGNAVDAAIAISFALAVSQPALNGLGGDFMAMIYNHDNGGVEFINGTGWAPSGLTKELIINKHGGTMPRYGPLSIVVPGMVGGVHALWQRHGSMEWGDLLRPAARLAETGLPVMPRLESALNSLRETYHDDETARTYLANRWERIDTRRLGKAISGIAETGPSFFYEEVGEAITEYVNSMGGVFSISDFKDYAPEWREPLKAEYRGYTVFESPPNSQGLTTLVILRDVESRGLPANIKERIDVLLDIYRKAYSLRDEHVGDPRFVDVPIDRLLKSNAAGPNANNKILEGDTTNFVVIDEAGNMVSAIQSLYHPFGSRITEPTYQITLNNRASDFKLSGPNEVAPRKRPLHTLSSMIIEKSGEPMAAIGISGGHFRPQQHALLLMNLIDYGMDIVNAIDAPRFLWDGSGVFAEEGVDAPIRKIKYPGATGVAHAIQILGRERIAYADPRGDGLAVGQN